VRFGLPSSASERSASAHASATAAAVIQTLRPHQWLKNLLVFVPLAAAHRLGDWHLLAAAAQAFIAYSLCASGVYVLNDLIDAPADRRHPHKCARPIASGRLPRRLGIVLVPLLVCSALFVGATLDVRVDALLACYFLWMALYTLRLRAIVLLDAIALAIGYALRVAAGAFAVQIQPSQWLLAFCIFLFFSLALVKRYAELALLRGRDGAAAHARAYLAEDQDLIMALGVSTGALAVLVLALYLSAGHPETHYRQGEFIWIVSVLLLYWLSHLWLTAHRGRMTDDPLVFALKDRLSRVLVLAMGVAAWLAV
jgi:4-hydroxybenzoate polyprenyltransferase